MSKSSTLKLLAVLLFWGAWAQAQTVWPGDVNNNGIVNCMDALYWGAAYGKTGAARASVNTNWQGFTMPTPWNWSFSRTYGGNGMNYAYADANGDGKIDRLDATNAVEVNFGKTHGTLITTADKTSTIIENGLVLFKLLPTVDAANAGDRIYIDIEINRASNLAPEGSGIAAIVEYDRTMVEPNSFQFEKFYGLAFPEALSYIMGKNNDATGTFEVAATYLGGLGRFLDLGSTRFARVSFKLANINGEHDLKFTVKSIAYVNQDLRTNSIVVKQGSVKVTGGDSGPCPQIVEPVCGSNGKTYLNSCYAEKAGVSYTPGVCNPDCVDPTRINPNANCPDKYEPVCGCNGVTYANACEAEAAGVKSYTTGSCKNNDLCYDPSYVVTAAYTEVSEEGVIVFNPPSNNDPVCGCNGITYKNSYVAEANGITFYTKGKCSTNCVDPAKMNPNADCTEEYDPVCGCNGVTYANECIAQAAGVVSYTPGVCGSNTVSKWCQKATPLECGNFLSGETTNGAGNDISNYPCSNKNYAGPERVYIINKTAAGNLQIGLEILTANLDLDLFLLKPDCNQITCLKSSTTSNTETNNEGIILEDAPTGTYYLVVDGPAAGKYNLEFSCGYLYCGNAIPLTCGENYNGNNADGRDDVSLYGCGNVYNVENNGPEKVHTFTLMETGEVTISLTNLSANLELFLLQDCDRGSCLAFSQKGGTSSESITTTLTAGTYYVVVDGYNGATSSYRLRVDCANASCNLDASLTPTNAACGQNNGAFTVHTTGGNPTYIISWSGPVSGTKNTQSNNTAIESLPAGTYNVTVTDRYGCQVSKKVTIGSSGNISIQTSITNASCGQLGKVQVTVPNAAAPLKVYLSGDISNNYLVQGTGFTLSGFEPGDYHLYIVDNNGCSVSKDFSITQEGGNFTFTATPNVAACGNPGSISIKTSNGSAPYKVYVTGPKNGSVTVNANNFTIQQLPGGTYTIKIVESTGCSYTTTVTVPTTALEVAVTPVDGNCNQAGSIKVNIATGKPNYAISWDGPGNNDGTATTSGNAYTISNLPDGDYTVTIKDGNSCIVTKVVHVAGGSTDFEIALIPKRGVCETPGSIGVDIYAGKAPYKISWDGPGSNDGSETTSDDWIGINDLPAGDYKVTVKDANGCSITQNTTLQSPENNLSFKLTVNEGNCGQSSSILVNVESGTPNYKISWQGPANGSANSGNNQYEIKNLVPGDYTVKVVDDNGCSLSKTIRVNGGSQSFDITLTASNMICETPGSIKININGGKAPYKINWDGPGSNDGSATSNSSPYEIGSLPEGNYSITVKDANNCEVTKTIKVSTTQSNLSLKLIATDGVCGQPGKILADVDGGTAPFKFVWEGPANGQASTSSDQYEIKDLPGGTYTIKVFDKNNCVVSNSILVTIASKPEIELTAVNGICETPGSIKVKISKGTAPYQISWDGPGSNDGSATSSTSPYEIGNLPEGNYKVIVKDANNCEVSSTIQVSKTENILSLKLILTEGNCGSPSSLLVDVDGGVAAYKFVWQGPVNGNATSNSDTYQIGDLPPGTYTIKVYDKNNCFVSNTIVVTGGSPGFDIQLSPTNGICATPGAIKVKMDGGKAPFKITWDGPGSNDGSTSTSSNPYDIKDLPSGDYVVTVKDANGCEVTKTTQVSIVENTITFNTNIKNAACQQNGSIVVEASGGTAPYSVTWDGPGSNDGNGTTSTSKYEIKDLLPGSYTVKIIDKNGCNLWKTVNVGGSITGVDITLTALNGVCSTPGSIKVKINTGQAPFKISWDGPGSNDGTQNTSASTYEIGNLPSGPYTVTVKDANNCTITKTTEVLSQEGNLDVNLYGINGTCGQNGSIKVNISGGATNYTIEWNGTVNGSTTTASNTYTIPNLPAGSYTIKVKDANQCLISKIMAVSSTPASLFTATPTNSTCETPGSIKLNISSGTAPFSITWTGNNTPVMTMGSGYTINNLSAGNYTIKVTDAQGCIDTKNVTINANQSNLQVSTSVTEGSCGEYSKVAVNISGGTAKYKIAWTGPQSGSVQVNGSSYDLTSLPNGKYTINITDANGCTASTMVTVVNSSGDLFKSKPFNGVCEAPGSIKLSFIGGMPGYSITWTGPTPGAGSTSDTTFTLKNLTPGTYNIKVTDNKGCSESETVTLGQSGGAIDFDAARIINACGEYKTIWVDIHSGMPTYTIKWDGPGNQDGSGTTNTSSFEIPDLPPGKYTITVFDKNQCQADTLLTIYDSAPDVFSSSVIAAICDPTSVIQLKFSGMPDYQVKWEGPKNGMATVGSDTYLLYDLPEGTYLISVTDAKGCSEKDTVEVVGMQGLIADIDGTNGNCSTEGKINVNIMQGVGPFSIVYTKDNVADTVHVGDTGELVIADIPAGYYRVTVASATGCTAAEDVLITVSESVLDATTTPTNASACSPSGKVKLNITGGNLPYKVNWTGVGVDQTASTLKDTFTIANLPAGTYTITIEDSLQCSVSEQVTINAPESNLEIAATVTNGTCNQTGQIVVNASGGAAPFTYKWTGASNGTQIVNTPNYTITNLSNGTYYLSVTDGGGCSKTDTVSVVNGNQTPSATFSFTVSGKKVTFDNQSSQGTYQWKFDDTNTSTDKNPVHTYSQSGTYNVCLKVTNDCGNKEICKAVTIASQQGVANIDVEDGSGGRGETIYVPVVIKNCVTNTLVSFAGSLKIENPNVGVITGILPGSITPQYNATNHTFSYYANNGSGIPCGEGQILFYVAVQLNGTAGSSTNLLIVNTPLAIEVGGMENGVPSSIPHNVTGGVVSVQSVAVVQGEIYTYWGDGLRSVEVNVNGDSLNRKDTTDISGHYAIPALPLGKQYMIQPKLDSDPANGLSTYALFVGQRFILGVNPPEIVSPYQIIAADANCDGKFTTLDLFIIQRLIIGTSEDFGNCPSWVFVKANEPMPSEFNTTNVFPYYSCDTMMVMRDTISDFIGVKVGDILGHANPQLQSIEPRSKGVLRLMATNRPYRAGEIVEMTLTSENFRDMASYQMGVSFDFNQLEFLDLETDAHSSFARIALNDQQAKDGVLRMSWFDPSGSGVSINAENQVLTLRFRALRDIDNLANLLEVNSRYMRSEAYTTQMEKMDIALQFVQKSGVEPNTQVALGYKLYQNMPNPFNQKTIIGFDLPEAMQADVIVYDQLGKVVKTFAGSYNRGYNQIEFSKESLGAGVYYYTLRTEHFAQTKSMVIFE